MRIIVAAAILFISLTVNAQNRKLDSLYRVLENLTSRDTTRINTLIRICYYEYTARPEKSKEIADEVLSSSRAINYAYGEGYGQRYLALYHWVKGDYEVSSKHGYEMLRVFETASDSAGMAKAYALLGLVFDEWGEFEKSEKYFLESLKINTKAGRKYDMAYDLNSLGALYYHFNQRGRAEQYFIQSLEIRKQLKDDDGVSQSLNNLARIAKHNKEYARAIEYLESTLAIARKYNNTNRISIVHQSLGEIFMLVKRYEEAEASLKEALALSKQLKAKKRIRQVYASLAVLAYERGDFRTALRYAEEKYKYQDSVFTEDKASLIAEMETRYETGKKEQAIQLLQRDKEIQALWNNFLIAGLTLVVLAAIIVIVWLRYRAKKNYELLNVRIDYLTNQHQELAQKYHHVITSNGSDDVESEGIRLLRKALEVVEQNIDDPLFGVEKMAEEIGMSRASLHRKMKAVSGISPSDFIRSVRLKRAAAMLRKKSDSITQVGFRVGFEDQSNFSKSFKKQFGVSPSEYAASLDNT